METGGLSSRGRYDLNLHGDMQLEPRGDASGYRVRVNASSRTHLALNGTLILDRAMYSRMQRLNPDLYSLDLSKPRSMSPDIGLPTPVVATIGAWLESEV